MREIIIIILTLTLMTFHGGHGLDYDESILYGQFPEGFRWGSATAAYQVSSEFHMRKE